MHTTIIDTLEGWLAHCERLHPHTIEMGLERVSEVARRMALRFDCPVITVAGTNGKGSTCAMIEAVAREAGYRTGVYSSPHLVHFEERCRLRGEAVDASDLIAHFAAVESARAPNDPKNGETISLSYFEFTTLAILRLLSQAPLDLVILEVGLGGRLDATNVIDAPRLTVITPVSIDHTQYLGETLAEIAGEKAGILKRRTPCVVAPQAPVAREVIEARAERLFAPLSIGRQDWDSRREGDSLIYQDDHGLMDLPLPVLPGPHQIVNAGTAIAALRELGFGRIEARAAVVEAEWPARMQRLTRGPLVDIAQGAELWLDGGHNPAGGEALAQTLAGMAKKPTHAICGMLNTKDVAGYMRPLAAQLQSLTAIDIPGEPNTLPATETARIATAAGLTARTAPDAATAVRQIVDETPHARLLICGSLYLAGHILRAHA